jgi:uncharacterized OsmC-like protein
MAQQMNVNGVDVAQLMGTIEQVKQNPAIAQFKFRATNTWVDGTHNRAIVKDFYGALKEDTSRSPWVFEIDEPPVLCGQNINANPVEFLLAALSGCMTTSLVAHAAARGIKVKKVASRYEGELDLQGFLGISEEVPVGYKNIRVFFNIEGDLTQDQKHELVEMAKKYSPVYNTIAKPVTVSVELEKSGVVH